MSIYTVTSTKSIQGASANNDSQYLALTVNPVFSTYYGFNAGNKGASLGAQGTYIGYLAGAVNQGSSNVFLGYGAGLTNTYGSRNFYAGTLAGQNNVFGSDNTGIGNNSLGSSISSSGNVALGSGAGSTITEGNNICIGTNCDTLSNAAAYTKGNVSIGTGAQFSGQSNLTFGNATSNNGFASIVIGS